MTIDDVRARLAFVSQYERTMVSGPDLRALLDEHAAARAALRDLLAVIHRDGGDHHAQVGAEQAVRDAHVVWADPVRERDEARADRDRLAAALAEVERQWTYGLTRLDRAESALAEVREAAAEVVRQQLGDDLTWWTPERRAAAHDARVSLAALRLADALAATPADLAATRDARVRAEALRDAADCDMCDDAERVRSMLRARADRIERGGR